MKPKTLFAVLFTLTAHLLLISGAIALLLENVSLPACHGYSAVMDISEREVILKVNEGKLVEASLLNEGKENIYNISANEDGWVVVRPENITLGSGEEGSIFVYMSPGISERGSYNVKVYADSACVRLQEEIKAVVE